MDVNSNKFGGTVKARNERLVKLINGVAEMKLGDYRDNTIDAFGDAYEFLMGISASALTTLDFTGEKVDPAVPVSAFDALCKFALHRFKIADEMMPEGFPPP